MILLRHVGRLAGATVMYAVATRRIALLFLVILGVALVALATASQVVAPIVVYPFV